MFSYELDAVFEQNFFAKSCECRRWLTLGRSKWIFLPTSPSQRGKNSLFRRLGGQLRRLSAYWRKNCAQGRWCYLRCTILPRLNSLKWSVLPWSVGFGSLLCNRRKDTTKFRKLAIFSKKSVQCPPPPPHFLITKYMSSQKRRQRCCLLSSMFRVYYDCN